MAAHYPTTPGVRFKTIEGFPAYCVGDDGSVWTLWRRHYMSWVIGTVWRLLKTLNRPKGRAPYLQAHLRHVDGTRKSIPVGRLVLTAFVGPCPPGMEACHDPDPDRTNCRLGNLRWDTHANNMRDAIRHGTFPRGERTGSAKLTEAGIREAAEMRARGVTWSRIGQHFGVGRGTVYSALTGKYWAHLRPK